jgi:Rieske Fe-S protein
MPARTVVNVIDLQRVATTDPPGRDRTDVIAPGGLLMDKPQPTRRSVVGAGLATALGAATAGSLSACSSDTGSAATSGTSSVELTVTSPTAGGGGAVLVKLADVPVGGAVAATLNGAPVIVAQPTAGNAVAFSAACTHQGCPVAPEGAKLNCSCHGSVFNALTGAVENGPATTPLKAVTVAVKGADVVAG